MKNSSTITVTRTVTTRTRTESSITLNTAQEGTPTMQHNINSNLLIAGSPNAGKTLLAELLATRDELEGRTVIRIDPATETAQGIRAKLTPFLNADAPRFTVLIDPSEPWEVRQLKMLREYIDAVLADYTPYNARVIMTAETDFVLTAAWCPHFCVIDISSGGWA